MAKKTHFTHDDLIFPIKQPISGYGHPRHLLAYGKDLNTKWSLFTAWALSNTVCVSPSCKSYQAVKGKVSFTIEDEDFDPKKDKHYREEIHPEQAKALLTPEDALF